MDQHRRKELQALLESILGSKNVYFQPPESYRIKYPCIIYTQEKIDRTYADDRTYYKKTRYKVTYIDSDKDGSIDDAMDSLSFCFHDRCYSTVNLHHSVYTLYY
jgi:hypothetical protein